MTRIINISGRRFGRLVAVSRSDNDRHGKAQWDCKCDCGQVRIVGTAQLLKEITKSCGCLRRDVVSRTMTTHGRSGTTEYRTWQLMIHRCISPNDKKFADYGGRGISVCERWLKSFASFFADMGERPTGCQLDRINNDGNYEHDNCRWADIKTQRRNTRVNHFIEFNSRRLTVAEWAEVSGLKYGTLFKRLMQGWSPEKAITAPVRQRQIA